MSYYHGSLEESIRDIISTGRFLLGEEKPPHAYSISIPDRVYLSRNMDGAIVYGCQYAGERGKLGVLNIEVEDESLLLPDEFYLGSIVTEGYYSQRVEEMGRDLDGVLDDDYRARWDEDEKYTYRMIWKHLGDDIKSNLYNTSQSDLLDQDKAVEIGLRTIRQLSVTNPGLLERLTERSMNVTSPPDNLIIVDAWSGTLEDFRSYLEYIDEEIEPWKMDPLKIENDRFPISARGIGRGWHGEPYRHSLARRGLGTRRRA